jgi:hypothetical protein
MCRSLGVVEVLGCAFCGKSGSRPRRIAPGAAAAPAAAAPQDRDALPWRGLLLYDYDDIKKTHRRVKPAIAGNLRAVRRR